MRRRIGRYGDGNALPIGNRRYSRLETCATRNWPDLVSRPKSASQESLDCNRCLRNHRRWMKNEKTLLLVWGCIAWSAAAADAPPPKTNDVHQRALEVLR